MKIEELTDELRATDPETFYSEMGKVTTQQMEAFIMTGVGAISSNLSGLLTSLQTAITVQNDELIIYRIVAQHMKNGTFNKEIWSDAETKLTALNEKIREQVNSAAEQVGGATTH